MYVAILVGNVLTVIESLNRESEKHKARMAGITGLMTQYKLPKPLRRQLRKWVVRAGKPPHGALQGLRRVPNAAESWPGGTSL